MPRQHCLPSLTLALSVCVTMGLGCDPTTDPSIDASTRDAARDAPLEDPIAPTAPMLPQRVCATGFARATGTDGAIMCRPFGAIRCAADELMLPGIGCTAVSRACPADGWPVDAPSDAAFVMPGASGGDGTRAAPFGTVAEALLSTHDVIALHTGEYNVPIGIDRPLRMLGACAEGVHLAPSGPLENPFMRVSADATVEHVSFVLARQTAGAFSRNGATLTLRDVVIDSPSQAGAFASPGSGLRASRTLVRGVRTGGGFSQAYGLVATGMGARLDVSECDFDDNDTVSVGALDRATATVSRIHVRGRGLLVSQGARAELSESAIDANGLEAVVVNDATLTVRASELRGSGSGELANAIGTSALIVENTDLVRAAAAFRLLDTASLEVRDCTFRDARVLAFDVQNRALFERISAVGFASYALSSELNTRAEMITGALTLRDATLDGASSARAQGLVSAVPVMLERVRIRNVEGGISLWQSQGHVLSDVEILHAVPESTSAIARAGVFALYVRENTSASFTRIAISDVVGLPWVIAGEATGSDISVHSTSRAEEGLFAASIVVYGGSLHAARVRVEMQPGFGLYASLGGRIDVNDLRVRMTQREGDEIPGTALGVYGADVRVDRFALETGELCGAHVSGGSTLMLSHGTISGFAVGACVQQEPFDLNAIASTVVYTDNGTPIQTVDLPIPAFSVALP